MPTQADKISPDATVVEGFEHRPGRHCGSTALTDLFRHYGLDLPEPVLFGLAAGASFFYVELPGSSPSRIISGRAAQLERQFIELTEGALELASDADPERSWKLARTKIDSGNPVILLTDLYYLDHYNKSAHFPGHAVVLAGYDSSSAYISDTDFEGLVSVPLESLAKARHSQAPPFPLKGEALTVAGGEAVKTLEQSLPDVVDRAIGFAANNMLEPPFGEHQGLPALGRLAEEVATWPEVAEDWQWCARFCYQVIERRGTGGGNFRKLYSEFLQIVTDMGLAEGLEKSSAHFAEVAEKWTELAYAFRDASESEDGSEPLARAAELVAVIAKDEERLWKELTDHPA